MNTSIQLSDESLLIQKTFNIELLKVKIGGVVIPAFCYPSLEVIKGWKLKKDEIIFFAICVHQSLLENPESEKSISEIKQNALQSVLGLRKSGDDFNMINRYQMKYYC